MFKEWYQSIPKRTIVLVLIFLTLLAIANIYIYFYRQNIKNVVNKYLSEITVCENIKDEQTCFEKEACEGIYDTEGNNLIFKSCSHVSPETLENRQVFQSLCEKTQGTWYKNKLGYFCLCQSAGPGKIFDQEKGCISQP